MKGTLMMMLMACVACCMTACNGQNKDNESKVLVAYFSATGNTRQAALNLAEATNATIYEITPEIPYTNADLNWMDSTSRSVNEMINHPEKRPAVKPFEGDIKKYDVVFIGYPIWWDLAPTVVKSFIEQLGLTDQRVIPFATSHSSQAEHSFENLMNAYPELNWQNGKLLHADKPDEAKLWGKSLFE